ncbi:hypothetical protein BZA77DRAFT_302401, partial [Pyronema omphalodes]
MGWGLAGLILILILFLVIDGGYMGMWACGLMGLRKLYVLGMCDLSCALLILMVMVMVMLFLML